MKTKASLTNNSTKSRALSKRTLPGAVLTQDEKPGAPKFKLIEKGKVDLIVKEPKRFFQQARETVGSDDIDFIEMLMTQVGNIFSNIEENTVKQANFSSAFLHGLKPRDQMEGILFAQMAGTHNLIMEYMRRAIRQGQNIDAAEDYTNRACRLMNLFLRQIETLEKYRGKSTQQKVIVEHVQVQEGGQAIVGNIERPSGGRGDEKQD